MIDITDTTPNSLSVSPRSEKERAEHCGEESATETESEQIRQDQQRVVASQRFQQIGTLAPLPPQAAGRRRWRFGSDDGGQGRAEQQQGRRDHRGLPAEQFDDGHRACTQHSGEQREKHDDGRTDGPFGIGHRFGGKTIHGDVLGRHHEGFEQQDGDDRIDGSDRRRHEGEGCVAQRTDHRAGNDPGFTVTDAGAAVVVHHQCDQPLQPARDRRQRQQPEHFQGQALLAEYERQSHPGECRRKVLSHVQYADA